MSLRIQVTDHGVQLALARFRAALRNTRPVMQAIGAKLDRNVNLRFDTKTDPARQAWTPWSAETAAARAREGRGTLLEYTGRMRDSLTHLADSDSVEVGFGVDYAQYHETGGRHLPQRPLLLNNGSLSQKDWDDALKVAMTAFRRQLRLENTP